MLQKQVENYKNQKCSKNTANYTSNRRRAIVADVSISYSSDQSLCIFLKPSLWCWILYKPLSTSRGSADPCQKDEIYSLRHIIRRTGGTTAALSTSILSKKTMYIIVNFVPLCALVEKPSPRAKTFLQSRENYNFHLCFRRWEQRLTCEIYSNSKTVKNFTLKFPSFKSVKIILMFRAASERNSLPNFHHYRILFGRYAINGILIGMSKKFLAEEMISSAPLETGLRPFLKSSKIVWSGRY